MTWKRALLLLLGLLIILIIIMLVRVFMLETKQPTPLQTNVTFDEELAIQRFSQALTFKTISYQDRSKFDLQEFDRFIDFLKESYPLVHENLELERINDYA